MKTRRFHVPVVRLTCLVALVVGSAGAVQSAASHATSLQCPGGGSTGQGLGAVYAWGDNGQGQVGKGNTSQQYAPCTVTLDPNDASVKAVAVSAGGGTTAWR